MSILKIENIIKYICKCDDYFSKEDKTGYSLCVIFCVVEREFPPPPFFLYEVDFVMHIDWPVQIIRHPTAPLYCM